MRTPATAPLWADDNIAVGSHISPRIRSQGGFFTVHRYSGDKSRFEPLENQPAFRKHLTKLLDTLLGEIKLRVDVENVKTGRDGPEILKRRQWPVANARVLA